MLGMLRDIAAKRKALVESEKGFPGFPSKVILHWASRGEAEFALLDTHLVRITLWVALLPLNPACISNSR